LAWPLVQNLNGSSGKGYTTAVRANFNFGGNKWQLKILIGRLKDFMIKTQRPMIPTLNIPDN
jgi:hypothetical protein